MAEERLQKILSRAGVASRRAAEEMILAGRVMLNGEVVRELGTRADPRRDLIRVDGTTIAEPEGFLYFVIYKPESVVTTLSDPEGRPSVGDLVRRIKTRVYPVGRLDYDAEGTLLLTNDGELAHKLTHPRWGVRRTYLAKVKGEPDDEALARLCEGVRLEDGKAQALEATFEKRTPKNTWIRLVVAEGRHHLVKRLCEAVGHPVVRLFRADYAGIGVAGMKPGDLRELTSREVQALKKAVSQEAPPPPGGLRPRRRSGPRPTAVRDPIYGTLRREGEGAPRGGRPGMRGGFGGPRVQTRGRGDDFGGARGASPRGVRGAPPRDRFGRGDDFEGARGAGPRDVRGGPPRNRFGRGDDFEGARGAGPRGVRGGPLRDRFGRGDDFEGARGAGPRGVRGAPLRNRFGRGDDFEGARTWSPRGGAGVRGAPTRDRYGPGGAKGARGEEGSRPSGFAASWEADDASPRPRPRASTTRKALTPRVGGKPPRGRPGRKPR